MHTRYRATMTMAAAFLATLSLFLQCTADTPTPPRYYRHQLVDHLSDSNKNEWTQRYYVSSQHFMGAGSPILLVLGGEGAIEPTTGLFYPFVNDRLAMAFGAYVLQPEHRFYGTSVPTKTGDEDARVRLLTPEQALLDAVRLVRHTQDVLQCSQDKSSSKYCPIITVGGSYPGFLSAMARLRYPDVVDMAYAASAPMKFYSQQVDANDYYNHISHVAEKAHSGCARAVRTTLASLAHDYHAVNSRKQVETAAASIGFCPESVPNYIQDGHMFRNELFMVVGYTFANDNMAYYPPSSDTKLYQSCAAFCNSTLNAQERMQTFLQAHFLTPDNTCMDMSLQLPSGCNATISSGDWSGVGTGSDGESWDFQTCTLLVEAISLSGMFYPRKWNIEWLTHHCQARFGVTPTPTSLVDQWHFDDLTSQNASRILFTNGLNDGWSVGAIKSNLSDTLLVLNFENGAHHSDLSHQGPSDQDTKDIVEGFDSIQHILQSWLDELTSRQGESQS